jgi:hypothetical protein
MTNCTQACRVDHNNGNETESSAVSDRAVFISDKVTTVAQTYSVHRLGYPKCVSIA